MNRKIFVGAIASLWAGLAGAQTAGVVTLRASPTSGTGSVTPVLTWSTNPVATSCRASGGWSGTKAASGTQTLTAIRANTNYTLTCSWGSGTARVNWTAPTTNIDGSTLTNLSRFKVMYGASSTTLNQSVIVDDPTRRYATLTLAPGTWYFAVRAVNNSNVESSNSNVASRTVSGATSAATATVTVTQGSTSNIPRTVSTNAWDVVRRSDGVWVRRAVVGQIPLDKPCSTSFRVGEHHYLVNTSAVTLTATPQSTNLVTYCEFS
jgi:hypothetical protein